MRKGHRPIHTAFAKQGGGRERKCVRVCERERKGYVQGRDLFGLPLQSGVELGL